MELWLPQLISAISSIAALVTAIIVYFTLREMILQRQTSYKPDLMCKPSRFFVSAEITDTFIKRLSVIANKENVEDHYQSADLEIYNIGLGTAKNLKVDWQFDYNKAIEFIETPSLEMGVNFSIENNLFNIKANSDEIIVNTANELKQEIDYVLPISTSNSLAKVPIPFSFIYLSAVNNVFVFLNKFNGLELDIAESPKLFLVLSFNDIGGKAHQVKQEIDLQPIVARVEHITERHSKKIEIDFILKTVERN